MKRLIAICAGICLAISAKAQLAFQSDILEFHPDINTTEVRADFPFTNIGRTPITIKDIKPSCGCTVATIDKMTYAPGESGVVKATYTIHGAMGFQQKEIAVTTVQNPDSIKTLTIKAYLPTLVIVDPPSATWKLGAPPDPRQIQLNVNYEKPIKFVGVEWSTDRVFAKLKTITKDRSYQVVITPLSTDDILEGTVVVKLFVTGSKTFKMLFIPFSISPKT